VRGFLSEENQPRQLDRLDARLEGGERCRQHHGVDRHREHGDTDQRVETGVDQPVGETGGWIAVRVVVGLDERSRLGLADQIDLVAGRDEPWTVGVHPMVPTDPPTPLNHTVGHHATSWRARVIASTAATSWPSVRSAADVAVIEAPVAMVLSTTTNADTCPGRPRGSRAG